MKLESYAMREALEAGDTATAVRTLATYYGFPDPVEIPITVIGKNMPPFERERRLLFWCGDDFYEWSSESGFDRGVHPYSLGSDVAPSRIESIILWK